MCVVSPVCCLTYAVPREREERRRKVFHSQITREKLMRDIEKPSLMSMTLRVYISLYPRERIDHFVYVLRVHCTVQFRTEMGIIHPRVLVVKE